MSGYPSCAGSGWSNPFLSSNTQRTEVGPPWLRWGRRLGKKQRRDFIPSDCTQQEVYLSLWEYRTQESVYQTHGSPPRPQGLNPHLPQLCTYYWCAVLFLVAQSCPTLCNPMDCSLPGFSVHRDSPGKIIGVGCHALLQGIFPTQGSNLGLPHGRQILYCLSHRGSPYWHVLPHKTFIESSR